MIDNSHLSKEKTDFHKEWIYRVDFKLHTTLKEIVSVKILLILLISF